MTITLSLLLFVYTMVVSHRCFYSCIFKKRLTNIIVQSMYLFIFLALTIIIAKYMSAWLAMIPGFWVFLSIRRVFDEFSTPFYENDEDNNIENEQIDDNNGNKKER